MLLSYLAAPGSDLGVRALLARHERAAGDSVGFFPGSKRIRDSPAPGVVLRAARASRLESPLSLAVTRRCTTERLFARARLLISARIQQEAAQTQLHACSRS